MSWFEELDKIMSLNLKVQVEGQVLFYTIPPFKVATTKKQKTFEVPEGFGALCKQSLWPGDSHGEVKLFSHKS